MGPSTVYGVPLAPLICVELGAGMVIDGDMAAGDEDDAADDDEAELVV
jgi:hypothetical protein